MKKFNSILAIATVALSTVFGFTSCDKADEPFDSCPNPQPIPTETTPVVHEDAYLYMPATGEQMKYMDVTCVLSVDGNTMQVNLSEMNKVKDAERFNNSKEFLELYNNTCKDDEYKDEAAMYEYCLGKARTVKILSIYCTAYTDSVDHEINYIVAPVIMRGQNSICFGNSFDTFFKGVYDLKGSIEVFNKYHKK